MPRTFKTAWFSKAARKALVGDAELCAAIREVELGQADDLGGGVFKKRIDKNRQRAIILANAGEFWVYAFLFAKKDKANLSSVELDIYRGIAALYRRKTRADIAAELALGELVEICHEN
jgi:hypothetical protein